MPTVLFVCQANMLRSAAAEALARAIAAKAVAAGAAGSGALGSDAVGAAPAWEFASAGVRAMVGSPIEYDVGTALSARGIDGSAHRARQLTARLLRDADLTVTFEVGQRRWAARELPHRSRDVLTIRRAYRLLEDWSPADGDALALLRADRHRYGPADEFADPVGTGSASINAAVDEIEALLRVIVPALLAGDDGRGAPRPSGTAGASTSAGGAHRR